MSNDTVKSFDCVYDYTVDRFQSGAPLVHISRLWFCEEDFAPQFRNASGNNPIQMGLLCADTMQVSQLCEVSINHRDLPYAAFKPRGGFNGTYYQVAYQLELTFGSELLFKMSYQGKAYGSVRAHYV